MIQYRVGIDVGGTNTDIVIINKNNDIIAAHKTPTTYNVTDGIITALRKAIDTSGINHNTIVDITIGTTYTTNAILQARNLSRVGLIRIAGNKPELPPCYQWPENIKSSVLAGYETVDGGIQCDNTSITPFDGQQIENAIYVLQQQGAEAVVVNSVFSPLNNSHEKCARDIIYDITHGTTPVVMTHNIGGIGFIERENAALLNAALQKTVYRQFHNMMHRIQQFGITAPIFITNNNGSVMSIEDAITFPISTISTGPTNSCIGAAYLAGVQDAYVIDIGGTSTDVSIIRNGFPRKSSCVAQLAGIPLQCSMPDIVSIACGGGSYVSTESNKITIGPDSAGYNITQEAYIFGGNRLTMTDIAVQSGAMKINNTKLYKAPISDKYAHNVLSYATSQIEEAFDRVPEYSDLPVVVVGGGAHIISQSALSQEVIFPSYAQFANAYGAARAEASGTINTVVSLHERENTISSLKEEAKQKAVHNGACIDTVRIIDVTIMPYYYLPDNMAYVSIMAAGGRRY